MGFVPPQIMNWDKANLEGKVKAKDIVATAKIMVKKMQDEGCGYYRCIGSFRRR